MSANENDIVGWLNSHPPPRQRSPNRCAWCNRPDSGRVEFSLVPVSPAPSVTVWLHGECWRAWHGERRRKAKEALGYASARGLRLGDVVQNK